MMNRVLFDISQQGYNWPPIILSLCFVLVGVAGVLNERFRRAFRIPPAIVVIIGVSVALGLLALQWTNQQRYQSLLANGQYAVAEGRVEQLQAAPERWFVVNGVPFATPDFAPALRGADGEPLHAGMQVTVFYTPAADPAERATVLRIAAE